MRFTSGINPPPYEADSGFLQVTSGCSHASCAFCSYFKDTHFKKSPMEEIEADIKEIPQNFGAPKRIFLQGADGFAADYDTLMKTAELIHKYVPSVKTIGGYARIDNFREKSVEQLRNMKAVGFAEPYIGVESGDDVILKMVNKGYDAAFAREQMEKLTEAGMPFIANFLNGLGGAGYGLSHAQKTAKIYEGMDISMIEVSSLTLVPKTILYRRRERGEFAEAGEHDRAKANLPEDKETLIEGIQELIDNLPEERMKTHRRMAANYF